MCRYLSNFASGNTQGRRNNHEDRTNCVFPPFYLPHKTQAIPKRSHLSLNVIFWSKIRRRGSRRQSEYSWAKYAALPGVSGSAALLASPLPLETTIRKTSCPPLEIFLQANFSVLFSYFVRRRSVKGIRLGRYRDIPQQVRSPGPGPQM